MSAHRFRLWICAGLLAGLLAPVAGVAQVDTASLSGQVTDPKDQPVPAATVTVTNEATGQAAKATTDEEGRYRFLALHPATYRLAVNQESLAPYEKLVVLAIGDVKELNVQLSIQKQKSIVEVTEPADLIRVSAPGPEGVIPGYRIEALPNPTGRYLDAVLMYAPNHVDTSPSIGAAPNTGWNGNGASGRSNSVFVDGTDAGDNAVNGVRSTVSQEAVQEFDVIMNNYMPEYGRARGSVVNIVTKSGAKDFHGNLYGYFRHKDLQARNPFSVAVDPATGNAVAVKQAYTRVRAGATLGGPLQKDRTFYFFSYETIRRQENGFTNIGSNNFGLVPSTTPVVPGVTLLLTPEQNAFVNDPAVLATGPGQQLAAEEFILAGSASSVALNGIDPGLASTVLFGNPALPGARFVNPIDCAPGGCTSSNLVPLPASFVPLKSLIGNYPVSEGTSLWSGRLDHVWNERNMSFLRSSVSPSLVTGIQVNAQNQNFGQNAGSRTSLQQYRDFSVVASNTTTPASGRWVNEARFQFARRGLHYGFSNLPGGSGPAVNITGFAFFGREPFSTVDRIERRWQWTDHLSWAKGRHTFKFGPDINLIRVGSNKPQIFELDFGGLYNFGALTPDELGLPTSAGGVAVPGMIAVQSYGLGLPSVFIQGIGKSNRPVDNTALAGFFQDSWKVLPRLTVNYGVRYDVELTPIFKPGTAVNAAAEPAMGVVEGMPRDTNNWSPRIGLAWDPTGSGKTAIRAGYGIFFDHPLLAVAFDSTTADGALSSQLLSGGGTPTRNSPLADPTALNAASIFQGVLNADPSMAYLPDQQRFDPLFTNSLFADQNFLAAGFPIALLPFTLPVARNFVFAYAQQGNLTLEHEFARNTKVSASYTYSHGLHINRPRDINTSNPALMVINYRNALAAGLTPSSPFGVVAPASGLAATASTCGVAVVAPGVLGQLNGCPDPTLNGQFLSTAAFFNFFRPSGPNPSFAGLVPGGYPAEVALAQIAGYPAGFGVPVPWSSVNQQESSGKSIYHGLTFAVTKPLSQHFDLLSSWTWSHAIDDSTDLQTLLQPQDNRFPGRERSNSTFDLRHRWVTSVVFSSPYDRKDASLTRRILADFTVAPILEFSSGTPFTVLTGTDFNLDLGSNTDRPSVAASGGVSSPFIGGRTFTVPTVCDQVITLGASPLSPPLGCTGDLPRNAFTRPGLAKVDLRISRKIYWLGSETRNIEVIADGFNLFNRFNVGDVSPLCDPLDPAACRAGEPTAALDRRLLQLALKINW